MANNTGNPIGSTAAKDLSDNAQNLDKFANGNDYEYADRLGRSRKSLKWIEDAALAIPAIDAALRSEEDAKRSELAANITAAIANMKPSIADGIYATAGSGPDNRFFAVPASGNLVSTAFRNDEGEAVEIGGIASSAAVKELQDVIDTKTNLGDLSNYSFILPDDDTGRIAIAVTKEGKTNIGSTEDVGGKVALIPGLTSDVDDLKNKLFESDEFAQSGYWLAIIDEINNRVGAGFDRTGDLIVRGRSVHKRLLALEDSGGNDPGINKWINGIKTVIAGGDSLTQGAGASSNPYPKQLAALLGYPVINMGVGGQTPQQIATRQGGYVNLLTITGNTIPASGAVDVTASTQSPITSQGGNNMAGTLFGVPGMLSATFDGSGNRVSLIFTRTTAGAVTIIDPATPFIPDTGDNEFGINVLWYGRNAFWTGRTDFVAAKAEVKAALAATIGNLKAADKKFIVMSVLTDNKEAEWLGTEKYNAITSLNEELKALYPRNFIDIRRHLVRGYNPALPQDVIDFGHDVTPTSLLSDTLHLNVAGYALVALIVYYFIIQKGW